MSHKDAAMFPIIASGTLFGIYLIFQVCPSGFHLLFIYFLNHDVFNLFLNCNNNLDKLKHLQPGEKNSKI